jgi:hypothetical protein
MQPKNLLHKHSVQLCLAASILLSLFGHCCAFVLLEQFRTYDFGKALNEPAVMMVELNGLSKPDQQKPETVPPPVAHTLAGFNSTDTLQAPPALPPDSEVLPTEPSRYQHPANPADQPVAQTVENSQLNPDSILAVQQERLVYQLSLAGMPVGHAQLDATNKEGEIRITSSIRSNSVISAFYPVNTTTDTRLIKGRYLLTRIRQQEGLLVSDTGFNLMYHERKIFWVDRLKKRFSDEELEALDTLDFVSGFYFLRLQPLKVGTSLTLRLYDGDTTVRVPITVLREETLSLPGMRSAATLVVQPLFAESGFFKNNRDLLVWFSADKNRIPVRFEATTPIGRIVAELVSSERTLLPSPSENVSNVVPADKIQYR